MLVLWSDIMALLALSSSLAVSETLKVIKYDCKTNF